MHWTIRTIVCGFATAGLLLMLIGCSANHEIFGGIGKQIRSGPKWDRDNGDTYGKIGYRVSKELHTRDKVGIYGEANHKSHPGRRDQGEENIEAGFYKRW